MLEPLQSSREILLEAESLSPYMKVLMFSGGKDSQAAFEVCRVLGYRLDAILFINTGCGLPETTEYVRAFAESTGIPFFEALSGSAYEDYVMRKGFFGVGTGRNSAHSYAFHVVKSTALRTQLAGFRERRRNRPILLVNGARLAESENRRKNMLGRHLRCDAYRHGRPASSNWWVSPLLHWSDEQRSTFLREQRCPINPVSAAICRSGECMCGTTQSQMERLEASAYSPVWGAWLDRLDAIAKERFGFGWGESMPVPAGAAERRLQASLESRGQTRLDFGDDSFLCAGCRKGAKT